MVNKDIFMGTIIISEKDCEYLSCIAKACQVKSDRTKKINPANRLKKYLIVLNAKNPNRMVCIRL